MKLNSFKIIKNRLKILKKRNLYFSFFLKKCYFSANSISIKKSYAVWLLNPTNLKTNCFKKICFNNGKSKSVNKKIKISRNSINSFLIDNTISFFNK